MTPTTHIKSFFDHLTGTISHVVTDTSTKACAVIDPVLGFDLYSGRVNTDLADQVIDYIRSQGLKLEWLLETHIHADHLSATHHIQSILGGKTGISCEIKQVLEHWVPVFDNHANTPTNATQFDCLFADGDGFTIGTLSGKVMHTPGHTPACVTYVIDKHLFVGDTLFAPAKGSARVDFPGGCAATLYQSIQKLYQFPDEHIMHLCHDYPADGEPVCVSSTVGEQKARNVMANATISEAEFTTKRTTRDQQLAVPKLIIPAIQANLRLGHLGEPDEQGRLFLNWPVNAL